jgi:hypothetical protein
MAAVILTCERSLERFSLAGYRGSLRRQDLSGLVTLTFASWNQIVIWLGGIDELRRAA